MRLLSVYEVHGEAKCGLVLRREGGMKYFLSSRFPTSHLRRRAGPVVLDESKIKPWTCTECREWHLLVHFVSLDAAGSTLKHSNVDGEE